MCDVHPCFAKKTLPPNLQQLGKAPLLNGTRTQEVSTANKQSFCVHHGMGQTRVPVLHCSKMGTVGSGGALTPGK